MSSLFGPFDSLQLRKFFSFSIKPRFRKIQVCKLNWDTRYIQFFDIVQISYEKWEWIYPTLQSRTNKTEIRNRTKWRGHDPLKCILYIPHNGNNHFPSPVFTVIYCEVNVRYYSLMLIVILCKLSCSL